MSLDQFVDASNFCKIMFMYCKMVFQMHFKCYYFLDYLYVHGNIMFSNSGSVHSSLML